MSPADRSTLRIPVFSQVRVRLHRVAGEIEFVSHVRQRSSDQRSLLLDYPSARHPARERLLPGLHLRLDLDDGIRLCSFDACVGSLSDEDPIGFWVPLPDDPNSIEIKHQRALIRLPLRIPILISIPDDDQTTAVRGETLNLSGGGVGVVTPSPLPVDQRVRVRFSLRDQEQPLVCAAMVGASSQQRDAAPDRCFESRLVFDQIDEATQERILSECYLIQIERRRRDLFSP